MPNNLILRQRLIMTALHMLNTDEDMVNDPRQPSAIAEYTRQLNNVRSKTGVDVEPIPIKNMRFEKGVFTFGTPVEVDVVRGRCGFCGSDFVDDKFHPGTCGNCGAVPSK